MNTKHLPYEEYQLMKTIDADIPPSWKDLMSEKHTMSEIEKVVVNCIATISSHQNYQNMVPSEIYDQMVSTRLTLP